MIETPNVTMVRLNTKGLLIRRRGGKADIDKPAMTRDEYLEAHPAAEVDALVDGYGEAALVHFARQVDQLGPERGEQLRRLAHG